MQCLAKATEMYFTWEQAALPCMGRLMKMPNFWMWSASGCLDAYLCENHWRMVVNSRNDYLSERAKEIQL